MTSKELGKQAQARRRHTVAMLSAIAALIVPMLAACGSSGSGASGPAGAGSGASGPAGAGSGISTAPPVTTSPTVNPYSQFDQEVASLLERRAAWQAPKRIQVDQTARIGFVIGDPSLLKAQIKQLVPGSYPEAAGNVKVGSTIAVQLLADPGDAFVTPSDAIDESMGEHTALLWTWYINAEHPSHGLILTAEIVTNMSDGHVQRQELALVIPVDRTSQYTLYQIFSNWATWAAIVAALAATGAAIRRRRKKRRRSNSKNKKSKIKKALRDAATN